jgi:hypothetical protein
MRRGYEKAARRRQPPPALPTLPALKCLEGYEPRLFRVYGQPEPVWPDEWTDENLEEGEPND